nr:K(+) efflux antiporter 3, chloroplastic [Tanacetum cinerariifolium]
FLSQLVRDSMELQAQTSIVPRDLDPDAMKPLQVRVTDLVATRKPATVLSGNGESMRVSQQERDRILMIQETVENPKLSNEVPAGEDGRGVLYCELNTDNDNVSDKH